MLELEARIDPFYLVLKPIDKNLKIPNRSSKDTVGWELYCSQKVVVCPEDLGIIPLGFKLLSEKPCLAHIVLEPYLIRSGLILAVNSIFLHKDPDTSVPFEIIVANTLGDYVAIKEHNKVATCYITEAASKVNIITLRS